MARTAPTHSRSSAKRNRVRERWAQRGFSPTDLLNLWKRNGAWMFVEDAARAVRFARESAAQLGGDPARLVLMGHSAGAYIAAMLSFDPLWLRQVGLNSQTDLAAFIGLAGPYDFLPIESRTLRAIFGGANRAETQPLSFVTGKEASSLLITARRDRLVSPGNSRRMAAKIRAYGGVAEERTYGGVGHLTLIGAFAPGLRVLAPVLHDVTQFVWRVTRRQAHIVGNL